MSDDCTCLYGAEGDMPECFSSRLSRARKAHTCSECRREIPAGAFYEAAAGKWDGDFQTFRTCSECREIRGELYCDGTWSYGMLWADIEEQIFAGEGLTLACIDKLSSPEAKSLLQRRWMDYVAAQGKPR